MCLHYLTIKTGLSAIFILSINDGARDRKGEDKQGRGIGMVEMVRFV